MHLKRIDWDDVDWKHLDQYPDRTIHQTREWLQFVQATQNAEPVIAALVNNGLTVGFYTGLIVRKFGLRILGSPFPGWTTSYMGFNLDPGVSRTEAAKALVDFAFRDLGCVHTELTDRRIAMDDALALGYEVRRAAGFEVDLTPAEEVLFGNMTSACRRAIRKSVKSGVTIQQVVDGNDARAFVDDYYPQLEDVFAKQSLVPTYPRQRVEKLVEHLFPTGRLLLLRALDPQGKCIATGIFPAYNDTMFFWGGASWRSGQPLRPNEAVMWHAMRYWKERGIARYDMSGQGEYKRKYGAVEIVVPSLVIPRTRLLQSFRDAASAVFSARQRLSGILTGKK